MAVIKEKAPRTVTAVQSAKEIYNQSNNTTDRAKNQALKKLRCCARAYIDKATVQELLRVVCYFTGRQQKGKEAGENENKDIL